MYKCRAILTGIAQLSNTFKFEVIKMLRRKIEQSVEKGFVGA
jgi:hypothetical protein